MTNQEPSHFLTFNRAGVKSSDASNLSNGLNQAQKTTGFNQFSKTQTHVRTSFNL